MTRELLMLSMLTIGQAIGVDTEAIKREEIGKCEAIILESNLIDGGLTLPLLKGDSVIVYDGSKDVLVHERVHSRQICEMGSTRFAIEYMKDRDKFEKEANKVQDIYNKR